MLQEVARESVDFFEGRHGDQDRFDHPAVLHPARVQPEAPDPAAGGRAARAHRRGQSRRDRRAGDARPRDVGRRSDLAVPLGLQRRGPAVHLQPRHGQDAARHRRLSRQAGDAGAHGQPLPALLRLLAGGAATRADRPAAAAAVRGHRRRSGARAALHARPDRPNEIGGTLRHVPDDADERPHVPADVPVLALAAPALARPTRTPGTRARTTSSNGCARRGPTRRSARASPTCASGSTRTCPPRFSRGRRPHAPSARGSISPSRDEPDIFAHIWEWRPDVVRRAER